jgi:hypothetical protein
MPHTCETLVDQGPFEINVSYSWTDSPAYEAEPGNPNTYVERLRETELLSVEVVIAGKGIDILPQLTEKAKQQIVHELSHEE